MSDSSAESDAAPDIRALRTALSGPAGERLAQQLLDEVAARYGEAPLVARVLSERPELYVPTALKNGAAIRDSPLGARVAELCAVAAATALRCEHCIRTHSEQALNAGATLDDLFAAMVIAGTVAESAAQSYAFREYQRLKRRTQTDRGDTPHPKHPPVA